MKRSAARPKPKADPRGELIAILEGLIREHRAGGDPLNRIVYGQDRVGAGSVRLSDALTLTFKGWGSIPEYPSNRHAWQPGCDGVEVNKAEHALLVRLGRGSAAAGAEGLVKLAVRLASEARERLIGWACEEIAGLRLRRKPKTWERVPSNWWDVPVSGEWFDELAEVCDEVNRRAPALASRYLGGVSPWDLLRALLRTWEHPSTRALRREAEPRSLAA